VLGEDAQEELLRRWPDFEGAGFARIPRMLENSACQQLAVDAEHCQLSTAPPLVGLVRQRLQSAQLPFVASPASFQEVGVWFREQLHGLLPQPQQPDAVSGWPNEVTVARYDTGDGISAHRDHARYAVAIVICSLTGLGRLQVVSDRKALSVEQDHVLNPGDVVLLAAAGRDSPMHVVRTLYGPRLSISFRFDSSATDSIAPAAARLNLS
jgi:hypothetical protein